MIVFRVEGVKTDVADTTKASPELQQLLAEIAKKNAELHILESRLKEAQERVKKPEQPRAETPEPGGRIQLRFDGAPENPAASSSWSGDRAEPALRRERGPRMS